MARNNDYTMRRYQEEIKSALRRTLFAERFNAYHEFLFELRTELLQKFVMFSFAFIFSWLFVGFFYKEFIYLGFGGILILMIYLLIDKLFLIKWKKALNLLAKRTNEIK